DVSSKYYEFWKSTGSLSESGYSFPSGHTTAATAFGVVLFLLKNKKYSWSFLFFPVVMGFTRIYFTVHYASDIFGGFFVGVTAALFAYFTIKLLCQNEKFQKLL
ncbi:MAG: phosphatase PAP2 family protein, partial [Eubacteriales bacterium]|nr:phosphatase PAP2 family protein [Eubacteriales bacterium]